MRGAILAVLCGFFLCIDALAGEAEDRKARSVATLTAEGVPHIDWLPLIETEAESHRRAAETVVRRTVALAIVAVKGETADLAMGQGLITQFDAQGFFTPLEQGFMDDPSPGRQDQINAVWRYEAVHVLLWALGFYDTLGRPDKITDVPRLAALLRDLGTDGLLKHARLRPQAELLNAADLIYRYHWAARDANLNGRKMPAGLDLSVVMERHYTLNWLIMDVPWDEVDTST